MFKMDVEIAIKNRRSVRKYQNREVEDAVIEKLIESARLAPSAYNAQPSRFVIIKTEQEKVILEKNNIFKQKFVYLAPLIIVCLGDPDVFPVERMENTYSNPGEIAGETGAVRDVSIASQNLVLQATELGLGTCYVGLVAREKLKEILQIPGKYVLPFVITAGYPDETPNPSPRKPVEKIILKQTENK